MSPTPIHPDAHHADAAISARVAGGHDHGSARSRCWTCGALRRDRAILAAGAIAGPIGLGIG
jgi:hypothetical protein